MTSKAFAGAVRPTLQCAAVFRRKKKKILVKSVRIAACSPRKELETHGTIVMHPFMPVAYHNSLPGTCYVRGALFVCVPRLLTSWGALYRMHHLKRDFFSSVRSKLKGQPGDQTHDLGVHQKSYVYIKALVHFRRTY